MSFRLTQMTTVRIFRGCMSKIFVFISISSALVSFILLTGCRSNVCTPHTEDPMGAAYRHVLTHWQSAEQGEFRRGYNIAAVLVSPEGKILAKELNSVIALQDCTQHAEMRLIQRYLAEHRCFNLRGCSVYTTLEPCAMCTATMGMAGIDHVYYGQSDPAFGKAAERLSQDTTPQGGYPPYPRVVHCELLWSPLQRELEDAFRRSGIKEITKWLATDEAKSIFLKYLTDSNHQHFRASENTALQ